MTNKKLKTYEIVWSLGGTIEIEAENEEQAEELFNKLDYNEIYKQSRIGDEGILEINEMEE